MKQLHHLCIQTDTYDASLDFYRRIFEFEIVKETPGFHGRFYNTWLRHGSLMIELQTHKADEVLNAFSESNRGLVHFCFIVDDIEREYARIKQLGYDQFKQKNGADIYEVEGGKLFKVIAPEGTIIELRDGVI